MNTITRILPLIILLLVLLAQTAMSQPETPGFGLDGEKENGAAIGSGLAFLVTLCAGYGLLKLKRRNPGKT